MTTDLTSFVLAAVRTQLDLPDLYARTAALPGGEPFITLFTTHRLRPCANSPTPWKANSRNWNSPSASPCAVRPVACGGGLKPEAEAHR